MRVLLKVPVKLDHFKIDLFSTYATLPCSPKGVRKYFIAVMLLWHQVHSNKHSLNPVDAWHLQCHCTALQMLN